MLRSIRLTLSFLSVRQRATYVALVAARTLTGLLDVMGIILIGIVASVGATQLLKGGTTLTIFGFKVPTVSSDEIVVLVIVVLIVFLVKALLAVLFSFLLTRFVARLEVANATNVAELLLRSDLDSVKRYSKAEFQYAITGSMTYTFTGILNNIAIFFSEGFLLILVSATFFIINTVAAAVALAYFALIILIIQLAIGRNVKRAGVDAVEGTVDTTNTVSDTIDTFREISVAGKQRHFIDRIHDSLGRIASSGAILTFLSGMPRYVVETALMLGVVAFVAVLFLTGQLASGFITVGVFLTGGVRIMASLLPLQNAVLTIRQNVEQSRLAQGLIVQARAAGIDRVEAQDRRVAERTSQAVGTELGLPIEISRVHYRYPGDDHETLKDISMSISAGQNVAIIGPSGAGKTTLVDLILGLLEPSSGSVLVDGAHPLVTRTELPGTISYVPQKPGIVSGTILENIALGVDPEDIDRVRARDAINAAFLGEFIDSLPDGLDTSVGKQVDSLSGGQIQRLGLARALYTRPRLIILDEATSGLDAGSEAFVSDSLRSLYGAVTIVVIAHRLSTIQHADTVFVIDGGEVVASGDFATMRATVPMVAEYVKLMSFDTE
ncbi:MAG: ABC transporter ATP-binding protein [Acidobacteria bacterium]|nr:ABC transporter ATP-binding protein [Acidobacteriota bacterium]